MSTKPVVTRFAPSPTGFQHIGGMRTALFAWLWARKNNGTFILRIEDTDREREVAGAIEHVQESLEWLGLHWDFGPNTQTPFGSCIQSQRLESYHQAAQKLIEKGLAYPDPYSAEEVDAFRKKAQAEKRPFLFREHRPEHFAPWDGTRPLRFKVPEIKRYTWYDEVRGELSAGEEALDDFILIKSDGFPTYNLAHIVDDHAMGVTHIMRADEFISSTPKFLALYDALEIPYPHFVTLPPILRDDRTKKLGKRDGAKDILEYRAAGYLPDAMINFLALIGWNPGTTQEIFTREDLIAEFDITRIQAHGAVLDEEKLKWLNRAYLQHMSVEEFAAYITPRITSALSKQGIDAPTHIERIAEAIRDRIHYSEEVVQMVEAGELDFFFKEPSLTLESIAGKGSESSVAHEHLTHSLEVFSNIPETDFASAETLKTHLWEYATEHGRGAVLWPLRYALTGRDRSPDPFTVASVIGKERVISRIESALRVLAS